MGKDGGVFVSEAALTVPSVEGHGVKLSLAGGKENERMIKLRKARLRKILTIHFVYSQ